jgi:catechol 2,3-dioxygenase
LLPVAYFFAAGRYHHHIATNTWLGTDILPASPESIGLNHFSIELPNKEEFDRTLKQLQHQNIVESNREMSSKVILYKILVTLEFKSIICENNELS